MLADLVFNDRPLLFDDDKVVEPEREARQHIGIQRPHKADLQMTEGWQLAPGVAQAAQGVRGIERCLAVTDTSPFGTGRRSEERSEGARVAEYTHGLQ